jgi:gliding motility-associated-like protein
MKRNFYFFCFIFLFFFSTAQSFAQLSFNNGLSATQLAQLLAGAGVSVSNATFNCAATAIGSFNGTSSLGFSNGIILSSGDISLASPNSNSGSAGSCNSTPGEDDLNSLAGATTYDACALEFDVIPLCDTIKFKYVFGSDEYPEYVNSGYNDAFAFFINGPGIPTPQNIAKLPGTSTFVTIDNVNSGSNSQYYVSNSGTTLEYDGHTVVLTAFCVVQSCQTYHMKIVIADAGDCVFDSGVFLEAGSLQCGATVAATATVQNAVEGCQDGSFEFCRTSSVPTPTVINYTIGGNAVNGTDYNTIANSVTIPAGQTCASLPIIPVDDGVAKPGDSILIIYQPGPCPVMDTVVIYVTDNILNAGPDKTICSGNTTTTIGPAPSTGTTYSWSPATGLSNATIANPTITATNTGTSSVNTTYILTATTGVCAVSDTVVVTVDPLATADAGTDQTVCGGSVQLTGTITGAPGGTWTGGAGTFSPSDTSLNTTYTPTTAEINSGTITLTLAASGQSGSCLSSTDDVVISISVTSTASAGPDQTVCVGNTAILSGSFGGNATAGLWTGGTGIFTPDASSPTATYLPSTAESTAGSVTLTFSAIDANNTSCPPVSDQMTITINQQPTANAGSAQYVCSGESITLAGTIGGTATSGTWSGGSGTFAPNNTTLNAVYTPTASEYAAGSVILTLTTDDPAGPCTFSSSNVTMYFYENPAVDFTAGVSAGCPIHCTDFTDASTIGGGATIIAWNWDFGDGGEGSTTPNPSNCFLNSGYYDVELTVTSSDGCVSSLTKTQLVEVYAIPEAEFSSSPAPATVIEPLISFTNESSADVVNWIWDFGVDTAGANTANPAFEYPSDTANTYLVTLIVSNSGGCFDTVQHQVIIGPAFTFYIPNAFTPNGDGKNDLFFGSGTGIGKYELRIFDRWGNMAFKTKDITEGWDGKANDGKLASQVDVYVWKVEITDVLNKKHNYMGTVTISR